MARSSSDGTLSNTISSASIDVETRWAALRDFLDPYWQRGRPYLPPVNFITVHHAYFIIVGLLVAAIFHGVSKNEESIPTVGFTDSWFLVTSAFTGSGLNTIDLADLATGQQVALFIMMIAGSPVLVSLVTIGFRVRIFEKRFDGIVEMERERRRRQGRATGTMVGMAGAMFGLPVMSSFKHNEAGQQQSPTTNNTPGHIHFADERPATSRAAASAPTVLQPVHESKTMPSPITPLSPTLRFAPRSPRPPSHNPSTHTHQGNAASAVPAFDFRTFVHQNKANIGRNGQFFDLDDEQREYLGGVEYRALKLLFYIVGAYFIILQVMGSLILGGYMAARQRDAAAVNGQDPWWTGVFLAGSSFHCAGMTLLDAGIAAYADDGFVLFVVTVLSFMGSAFFPACIRVTFWIGRLIFKYGVKRYGPVGHDYDVWLEAFDFVLKYPRRLFMLMFPSKANLVFVGFFSTLVAANWFLMLLLGMGNAVLEAFPLAKRVGLTLFQATTTLSGGFAVFSISGLWPDTQLLLLIIMYLAAYPEIIVMRNSNVYEERSLGLYSSAEASKQDADEEAAEKAAESSDPTVVDALLPTTNLSLPPLKPAPSHTTAISTATQPIRTLASVGRRGTAFVGKQVIRRMNDFHGVGVVVKPKRRATNIDPASTTSTTPVTTPSSSDGGINLVSQHLRGQLSHDMWSIAFALFLIATIETSHTIEAPGVYSIFNMLFEIVSGYTNIGISIGLPDSALSFAGGWYEGSKIVMVLMMIRGRHRGLPVALDHSVKLPGWDDARKEDEDAEIRRSMSRVRASVDVQQ